MEGLTWHAYLPRKVRWLDSSLAEVCAKFHSRAYCHHYGDDASDFCHQLGGSFRRRVGDTLPA